MNAYADVVSKVGAFLKFLLIFLHDILGLLELVGSMPVSRGNEQGSGINHVLLRTHPAGLSTSQPHRRGLEVLRRDA